MSHRIFSQRTDDFLEAVRLFRQSLPPKEYGNCWAPGEADENHTRKLWVARVAVLLFSLVFVLLAI